MHVHERVGVSASPGSSTAAVASNALVRGASENHIMQAMDWASAGMLYSHYVCILPAGALGSSHTQSVLQVLLTN